MSNKELAFQKLEINKRAAEVVTVNNELAFQQIEKGKRNPELGIDDKDLASQNIEKGKIAAELIIANKKVVIENAEKEKRAAELIIANQEIHYQIMEKEKLAAALNIANKELAFQYEEKRKCTAELVNVNEELLFQKEKRAAELIFFNQEILYQNIEIEKIALELELARSELQSFSYSVSHDLRAPLRAISCFTEVMVEDYTEQLDENANKVLKKIISNSKKMGKLIDNLLEFSRLIMQPVSVVNIPVKVLVETTLKELLQIEPARIINITMGNLEDTKGDRDMLKQVFVNLISNALKYTRYKEVAEIGIGCRIENESCIYYVKDNGSGFDMNYYHKIFGVFQRLHCSKEFDGSGIGLALTKKIIDKHGGKIWGEGKVKEGACFYISLPYTLNELAIN